MGNVASCQWLLFNSVQYCWTQDTTETMRLPGIENVGERAQANLDHWAPLITQLTDRERAFSSNVALALVVRMVRGDIERACITMSSAAANETVPRILQIACEDNKDMQWFFDPICGTYPVWCEDLNPSSGLLAFAL